MTGGVDRRSVGRVSIIRHAARLWPHLKAADIPKLLPLAARGLGCAGGLENSSTFFSGASSAEFLQNQDPERS